MRHHSRIATVYAWAVTDGYFYSETILIASMDSWANRFEFMSIGGFVVDHERKSVWVMTPPRASMQLCQHNISMPALSAVIISSLSEIRSIG